MMAVYQDKNGGRGSTQEGDSVHLDVFLTFHHSLGRWAGLLSPASTVTCSQSRKVVAPSGDSEVAEWAVPYLDKSRQYLLALLPLSIDHL